MIQVTFTDEVVFFEGMKTGQVHEIRCADYPEVFGHSRHLLANFEAAEGLIQAAFKAVHGWSWLAPRVVVRIEREMTGGLADVDHRIIKDFLTHAGAREVTIAGGV